MVALLISVVTCILTTWGITRLIGVANGLEALVLRGRLESIKKDLVGIVEKDDYLNMGFGSDDEGDGDSPIISPNISPNTSPNI
jgi:hypothetical protein